MFQIGEKVVYKTYTLCSVEAIETPAFFKGEYKKYYKLRCLYSGNNEVVYVPVDSDVNIRKIMSEKQALECFDVLRNAEINDVQIKHPVRLAEHFQMRISEGGMEGTLAVLKEILIKEKINSEQGKKLRQVEEHYLGMIEKAVVEELSFVLGKEKGIIKEMIKNAAFGE